MTSSVCPGQKVRTRRGTWMADVQRHGWLIGLIAGGLIAAWSTR